MSKHTPFFACGSKVLAISSVFRFFALREKKRNTKEEKYRCEQPNVAFHE
jgi:hypothetical protein